MAYAVQHTPARFALYALDIFAFPEIRVFAKITIIATAQSSRGFVFFKKWAPPQLGYDKASVIGISLFLVFHISAPPSPKDFNYLYNKQKAPQNGEFVVDCIFFGVDCTFLH